MDSVPTDDGAHADSATAVVGATASGTGGFRAARSSAAVSAADESLATIDQRPLEDHPEIFTSVHQELQRALSEIDNA